MRIAFFTDTYEPQINGVVTSINMFAKYLEKSGNRVHIFCPKSGARKKNVHTFASISFPNYPGYRIAVPYEIKKIKKFDIFHVHTPFSMGLTGITAGRFYKRPVIGTYHTLLPEFTDYFIKTLRFRKFLKRVAWKYSSWFYNMCDVVIAPSPEIKALLKSHGVTKRIEVVPTGIEIPKMLEKNSVRKKYKLGENEKVVLHVGRISKEKNIEFILRAMKKKPAAWKIIIASDGPCKKQLEEAASKIGVNNVLFTGFVSKDKLNELYFLADVLVVASKSETQSIVVAEAAARGLPIVTLDTPVIANFVRRNGLGIVAGEKNFLTSVRKAVSRKRKPSINDYTIKETAKKLENIYRQLLDSAKT